MKGYLKYAIVWIVLFSAAMVYMNNDLEINEDFSHASIKSNMMKTLDNKG